MVYDREGGTSDREICVSVTCSRNCFCQNAVCNLLNHSTCRRSARSGPWWLAHTAHRKNEIGYFGAVDRDNAAIWDHLSQP